MNGPRPRRGPLSTIAGWMATIAVIGVAIAFCREQSEVAALSIAISMVTFVPAMIGTEIVDRRRRRAGRPMSREQKMTWILALTIQIPAFLMLVVGLSLCLYGAIR